MRAISSSEPKPPRNDESPAQAGLSMGAETVPAPDVERRALSSAPLMSAILGVGYAFGALDFIGIPTHFCAAMLPPPIASTYSPWFA